MFDVSVYVIRNFFIQSTNCKSENSKEFTKITVETSFKIGLDNLKYYFYYWKWRLSIKILTENELISINSFYGELFL